MSADRKPPDLGVAFVLANGGRLPASIKQKVAARPVRKYRMLVKETREFYITVSARSVVGARAFVEVGGRGKMEPVDVGRRCIVGDVEEV